METVGWLENLETWILLYCVSSCYVSAPFLLYLPLLPGWVAMLWLGKEGMQGWGKGPSGSPVHRGWVAGGLSSS